MARKKEQRTIIRIERSETGMIVKSDRGLEWAFDFLHPEIALTSIIAYTLSNTVKCEDWFNREYIIEMKIEHKNDE